MILVQILLKTIEEDETMNARKAWFPAGSMQIIVCFYLFLLPITSKKMCL